MYPDGHKTGKQNILWKHESKGALMRAIRVVLILLMVKSEKIRERICLKLHI